MQLYQASVSEMLPLNSLPCHSTPLKKVNYWRKI